MNKVILSGRLARDIAPIYSDKGLCISNFTLMVERPTIRRRKKADAAETSETPQGSNDYINCVAFGKNAETLANFIHAGKRILVYGKLQSSTYVNKEGQKVYKTEVVVKSFEYMDYKDSSETVAEPNSFESMGLEEIPF